MTLPKGFGSGGGGGAGSADVEKMIGRRVENMTGMITASYIAAWLATFGGTAAGYFVYPWAYPTPSGHYAFIVLTIVEAIGYLFCVKVIRSMLWLPSLCIRSSHSVKHVVDNKRL